MEDIPSDYERYDALAGLVGEVVSQLDAAVKGLTNRLGCLHPQAVLSVLKACCSEGWSC